MEPREVLVTAKGTRFISWCNRQGLALVPSTTFYIITVENPERCLPEFLEQVYSQETVSKELLKLSGSSTTSTLRADHFLDTDLHLPPLHVQRKLVEFGDLLKERNRVQSMINQKQATILEQLILNYNLQ
jgi:restriction endonuclease S subunit